MISWLRVQYLNHSAIRPSPLDDMSMCIWEQRYQAINVSSTTFLFTLWRGGGGLVLHNLSITNLHQSKNFNFELATPTYVHRLCVAFVSSRPAFSGPLRWTCLFSESGSFHVHRPPARVPASIHRDWWFLVKHDLTVNFCPNTIYCKFSNVHGD